MFTGDVNITSRIGTGDNIDLILVHLYDPNNPGTRIGFGITGPGYSIYLSGHILDSCRLPLIEFSNGHKEEAIFSVQFEEIPYGILRVSNCQTNRF